MYLKYRAEEESEASEVRPVSKPRGARPVVVPRPDRIRRLGGGGGFVHGAAGARWEALGRLEKLGLVAYQPFHRHASEGFRQVLDLPESGPGPRLDRLGGER